MWFCPNDGTLLMITTNATNDHSDIYTNCFICAVCSYCCPIIQSKTIKTDYKTKNVDDDILGGPDAWKHVDRTMAVCPACNHNEAYFLQMQIRSADEPMSIFYKCVKCSNQWNDK